MLSTLLQRPIGVLTATCALVLTGFLLAPGIPLSILPEFSLPELVVEVPAPGQDAYELETHLLALMRGELSQLDGLQEVQSYAVGEKGTIRLRFSWGTEMSMAYLQVNERIDRMRHLFPVGLPRPRVLRLGAADIPMMQVAVSDSSQDLTSLGSFASTVLKRRLEQIDGLARCAVEGIREPFWRISPDPELLRAARLSVAEVQQAVQVANNRLGNARFRDGQSFFDLELSATLQSEEDLAQLPLRVGNRSIQLGEVADIRLEAAPARSVTLLGGQEVILLELFRRQDANLLDVAEQVREAMAAQAELAPALSWTIVSDQSEFVSVTVSNLRQSVAYGMVFAMLLLFLFLGSFRAPLLMAISVPVSLAMTLLMFAWLGLTFNLMTLAGLAIGVGVLIDNGIIIIERIDQAFRQTRQLIPSILASVQEMFLPLLASALTTLVVFLPLVLGEGMAGVFFRDQAIAIALALGNSLLVALCLLPVLYRISAGREQTGPRPESRRGLGDWLLPRYHALLLFFLRHRLLSWAAMLLILFAGTGAFLALPVSVFPEYQDETMELHLSWESEVGLEENRRRVQERLERWALPDRQELSFVGAVHRREALVPFGSHKAIIRLQSNDPDSLRRRLTADLDSLSAPVEWEWKKAPGLLSGWMPEDAYPLRFLLHSRSEEGLLPLAELQAFQEWLAGQSSVAEAILPDARTQAGYRLRLRGEAIARAGLEEQEVTEALATEFGQQSLGVLRSFGQQTPMQLVAGSEGSLEMRLRALRAGEEQVPVAQLVAGEWVQRYQALHAGPEGLRQSLWLRPQPGQEEALSDSLQAWTRAHGLTLSPDPHAGDADRLARQMGWLLLVSLALLFLVMVAQFENFRQPLLVMVTVPFGLAGSLLSLWAAGLGLNLMSGIGMVVVGGIVVNDAILKVDAANRLRREGVAPREAMVQAGLSRFRSIVLTSLTTMLAVAPILWTDGLAYALQGPLCLAILGGIASGTVASLFLVGGAMAPRGGIAKPQDPDTI